MKIRLMIEDEATYEQVNRRLLAAGIETGEDGEFVLTEARGAQSFLTVRDQGGQKLRMATEGIIYIESYGHDVEVHTADGVYYATQRLYQLSERLNRREFIRVSNSVIIARTHVTRIRPGFSMKFVLTMSNGTEVDVTRSYYYSFKEFFGI